MSWTHRWELFEDGGDAVWHPGLARGDLELATEMSYRLDMCFCVIEERTALVLPPAFAPRSLDTLAAAFPDLIEVWEEKRQHSFYATPPRFSDAR